MRWRTGSHRTGGQELVDLKTRESVRLMIIKAINVDGHNIVMSADVKQETEKGNNVPAFSSTTRQNMYYG